MADTESDRRAELERITGWAAECYRVAGLLAEALQANVPDPYPDGAAGVALAAWAELNDGDASA
jgi:hypothetical protein